MEAMILGTAAAEGCPAMWCGCANCARARTAGGRDIRARSSLFLPPDTLIDCGPDALYAVQRFGLDWSGVSTVLFTHSHEDHLIPQNLEYTQPVFAGNRKSNLTVFGNEAVREKIQAITGGEIPTLEVKPVLAFREFEIPGGTTTAIPSYHKPDEHALNYVVTRHGRTFLYALDLSRYDEETWEYLKTVKLDAVIMECTYGPRARDWVGHLGIADVVEIRDRLLAQGTITPQTQYVITHFSHNDVLPHEDFQALAGPMGLTVAYDGMRLEI